MYKSIENPAINSVVINGTLLGLDMREGKSAAEIEAVWEDDVKHFIEYRRPYLLYPDNL